METTAAAAVSCEILITFLPIMFRTSSKWFRQGERAGSRPSPWAGVSRFVFPVVQCGVGIGTYSNQCLGSRSFSPDPGRIFFLSPDLDP